MEQTSNLVPAVEAGASMPVIMKDPADASDMRLAADKSVYMGASKPAYVDFFTSMAVLSSVFFVLFLMLSFNAYYLRKKKNTNGDIDKSVIWTNAVVAIVMIMLAAILYYSLQLEASWDQMMVAT